MRGTFREKFANQRAPREEDKKTQHTELRKFDESGVF
jgi:hypothetical protein